MSDLTEILIAASNADRSAEARLFEFLQSNYGALAMALVQEIANPHKPIHSRTMASIYFKNTLNAKSVTNQMELHMRWKQLEVAQRNSIKETLLVAMTTVHPVDGNTATSTSSTSTADTTAALRFAAIAASEVACVELPYQEWPQFLPTITAACSRTTSTTAKSVVTPSDTANTTTDAMIQLAAYECLGLTCERIEEVRNMVNDVPDLSEATINAMLTTIVQGITTTTNDATTSTTNSNNTIHNTTTTTTVGTNTNNTSSSNNNMTHEIQFMALNALNKSLQFVHSNMEKKDERDFIIVNAILNIASQHNDARIRQLAYQCLDVIAAEYYDYLGDYMTQIFQLTVNAIQTDPMELVKIAAIECWCTISETESSLLAEEEFSGAVSTTTTTTTTTDANRSSLCRKYVESAQTMLVPLLLDTLSSTINHTSSDTNPDDYDEDDYDIRAAGATCLESFASTVGDSIVPLVIPFVQQNIMNNNTAQWYLRDAAIVAFSCILNGGPTTEMVGPYVHQSIPVLLNAFNDGHALIRDDATHCIANISREHIAAVQPDQVHAIIQGCILKLQESSKLAARSATVIFNMSMSIKSPDAIMPNTNVLSLPMLPLLQALLSAMDRSDSMENNLRVSAGSAASELILASALDVQSILRDLLPAIMNRMQAAFQTNVHTTDDREMKEQLLGLLCGLITPLYQKLQRSDVVPHTDQMMNVLLQVLQVPNANCHEEALRAIGAIATALDDDFTKYVSTLMPFVITGCRSVQAHELCMVSVGVVADLCAAVGKQVQPYCDLIISALTDCLQDASAHRDTKPVVCACFGEVAMAIGAQFEPYVSAIALLLMQASQTPTQPDDPVLTDFINKLRLSILDAYSGIILGLSDGKALHVFMPHIGNVLSFLKFLSSPQSLRDILCLEKAVALLGDIAQQMGTDVHIKQELSQPYVSQLIQDAGTSGDASAYELAMWTQGVVREVLAVP